MKSIFPEEPPTYPNYKASKHISDELSCDHSDHPNNQRYPPLQSLPWGVADRLIYSEGTLSYNLVSELKEVITKLHRSYLND